jgi:TetR/AcrR family transcriptional regulator, mexJK operon transcriptional repressor
LSVPATNAACVERILDAALEVFREHGYGASIDAVASRANVARQTIYNHFKSKEALFGAALEKAIAELFSTLRAGDGDLRARLIRFGIELRARALHPKSIKLQRVLIGEAPRFPDLADSFYRYCVLGSCEQMATVFAAAMRNETMRRDDPLETARLFMEMLVGMDRWRMLYGGSAPDAAAEKKHVTRAVDFFLRAYTMSPVSLAAAR